MAPDQEAQDFELRLDTLGHHDPRIPLLAMKMYP